MSHPYQISQFSSGSRFETEVKLPFFLEYLSMEVSQRSSDIKEPEVIKAYVAYEVSSLLPLLSSLCLECQGR